MGKKLRELVSRMNKYVMVGESLTGVIEVMRQTPSLVQPCGACS